MDGAIVALLSLFSIANPGSAFAEADWSSITIDNDLFVGNDNMPARLQTDELLDANSSAEKNQQESNQFSDRFGGQSMYQQRTS